MYCAAAGFPLPRLCWPAGRLARPWEAAQACTALPASGQPWWARNHNTPTNPLINIFIQLPPEAWEWEHGSPKWSPISAPPLSIWGPIQKFLLLQFSCHRLHLLVLAGDQLSVHPKTQLNISGIFLCSSPLDSPLTIGSGMDLPDKHWDPSSCDAPSRCHWGTTCKVGSFKIQQNTTGTAWQSM